MKSHPPFFFNSHDFQLHYFRKQTLWLGEILHNFSYYQVVYAIITLGQLWLLWFSILKGYVFDLKYIESFSAVTYSSLMSSGFCLLLLLNGYLGLKAFSSMLAETRKSSLNQSIRLQKTQHLTTGIKKGAGLTLVVNIFFLAAGVGMWKNWILKASEKYIEEALGTHDYFEDNHQAITSEFRFWGILFALIYVGVSVGYLLGLRSF
mmetsp:Transcript_10646/g.10749  ORF Transcript_10646/g.10749 Transcript_10646/m.10749 type:complete len:206 (+) Transcript_10646:395-1012(+)